MTNETPGYGYPSEPNPQNPYGQQPPQQPGYGVPQGPYDPQPGGPGPGTPPPGYGYPPPQGGYPQGGGYPTSGPQLPPWLGAPNPYGPTAPGTRVLANPGDRFLARLIDALVLLIPLLIVQFAVAAAIGAIMSSIVSGIVVFGYEALMMMTQDQQTVGKKVMKLRVVSVEHGGRPVDNDLWIRSAVYGLPQAVYCIGSLFYLVNVLSHLWDKPLQQCFHDKAAKTLVIKES
ncbi:RDD family protein [Kitasatospora sp. NPDC059747]|uniref:RDD family protein n=1 Tax=Kitasatospora sp. NPDC059747 TaxID=3346930 RepID=UPI0036608777